MKKWIKQKSKSHEKCLPCSVAEQWNASLVPDRNCRMMSVRHSSASFRGVSRFLFLNKMTEIGHINDCDVDQKLEL